MSGIKYEINQTILYKNSGIYTISDIRAENFNNMGKRDYYVLTSVFDKGSSIYVPTDSETLVGNMLAILSKEEIQKIIDDESLCRHEWISDGKARALQFEKLLSLGNREDILWIIKELTYHKLCAENEKKKLCATDIKTLANAKKIISEEVAYVFGMSKNDALAYITEIIEKAYSTKTRE